MNTPTPWKYDHYGHVCTEFDSDGVARFDAQIRVSGMMLSSSETADANTALIVRAVNSHQSLIDALSEAVNLFRGGDLTNEQAHALWKADAALALAKEPT